MGVDLRRTAAKFRLEAYLVDRLHRRLRIPAGHESEAQQRVELLCLAVVTRNLRHAMGTWIQWERTPIDDAIDEAAARNPQWTRFDWDCDGETNNWQPMPGERVRVFTRAREFIGYARVVHFEQPGVVDLHRKPTRAEYRFELAVPEWARIPGSDKANIGRVLPT